MAFWIPAAIIGSAVVGAASSANAGSQAANAATSAANSSNAAQLQAQREAAALNEPWRQAGMGALNQRNALLGLAPVNTAYGAGTPGQPDWNAYLDSRPDVRQYYLNNPTAFAAVGNDWAKAAEQHYQNFGRTEGTQLPLFQQPEQPAAAPGQSGVDQAYNTFLDSGYNRAMTDFTANDLDQIRSGMGAAGTSVSGSAIGAMGDRLARNRYQAFTGYENALAGISNTGSALSMQQGQNAMNTAGQIGANNQNAAAARGSSYMNTANALNQGLQNTTNVLAYGAGNGWFGGGGGTPMAGRTGPGYTDMRGWG